MKFLINVCDIRLDKPFDFGVMMNDGGHFKKFLHRFLRYPFSHVDKCYHKIIIFTYFDLLLYYEFTWLIVKKYCISAHLYIQTFQTFRKVSSKNYVHDLTIITFLNVGL